MRPERCSTALLLSFLPLYAAAAEAFDGSAARGDILVATLQAAGAQIYECRADASGQPVWQFREPIATLLADGATVGRHYAGPTWELTDGNVVTAAVTGRAPGKGPEDIPLLALEVASHRGTGQLDGVTTIHRINTRGGAAEGSCSAVGAVLSVPYQADYNFYRSATALSR